MKKKLLIIPAVLLLGFAIWFYFMDTQATAPEQPEQQRAQNAEDLPLEAFDKTQHSIDDPTSIWLVVNKDRPISTDYVPADLVLANVNRREDKSDEELMLRQEVATSLEDMFSAATSEAGLALLLGSAYRSAALQETYYSNYVATSGQEEADKFSAKPGTSEHQTGMSADISSDDKTCYLEICFSETPEGMWLAENAHRFGFIIRYQEGKEEITGYQYEPWHVRYVGEDLAKEIYESNVTLEEFFIL